MKIYPMIVYFSKFRAKRETFDTVRGVPHRSYICPDPCPKRCSRSSSVLVAIAFRSASRDILIRIPPCRSRGWRQSRALRPATPRRLPAPPCNRLHNRDTKSATLPSTKDPSLRESSRAFVLFCRSGHLLGVKQPAKADEEGQHPHVLPHAQTENPVSSAKEIENGSVRSVQDQKKRP